MNRRLSLYLPLLSWSFLLVSCGQDDGLTAPAEPGDRPSLAVAASNTWTTKAPMPTPRTDLAAGVAKNASGQELLFAIGGFNPNAGETTDAVEAYNIATDSWASRAPLPEPLYGTNGVGNIGGKLYVSGGFLDGGSAGVRRQPSLYVYDPAANSWSRKADMPKRTALGVTGVIGGKLYVLIGSCEDCVTTKAPRLFRYDPNTDRWDATLPSAPFAHTKGAGGVVNGKFYVAGGRGRDQLESNKLDMYDPATNRWTTLAPMPTARSGAAAAVMGQKLFVIGQNSVDPGERQGQMEAYNPATNTWAIRTPLPGAGRGDLAAGRVIFEGRPYILAVGGDNVEGVGPQDLNQAYTP
jgi:N-acetylneuraminic acid mutarotase